SFSSKSYQYLPRRNTPVSPYLSSRSWMPLKIFEKVSAFLKFRRPSSLAVAAVLPPLVAPTRSGSAPRMDQLAPRDNEESSWPSISPMLKLTACAEVVANPRAMATERGLGRMHPGHVVFVMRLSVNKMGVHEAAPGAWISRL